MRLKVSPTARALVWTCAASLILTSGPWQVLAASGAAAGLSPSSTGRGISRIGRVAAQAVTLETGAHAGEPGRLVLRWRADSITAAGVSIRWTARGPLASGQAMPGVPVVVFDDAAMPAVIEDVVAIEIEATAGMADEPFVLVPEFTVETGSDAAHLPAIGIDGAPLRIPVRPSQFWAEATTATLWEVRSPAHEPMPAGVQPTDRGVRLQRDFASSRMAVAPEITEQHGLAVKAAVGAALGSRAAMGVVGGGGRAQQDVVVIGGVQFTPRQRLLVSAGALQQDVDLAFVSGTERRRLRQTSAGAAYRVGFGGPLQARVDAQAYFAESGSLNLSPVEHFEDTGGQAQIFRLDRRVAGAMLFGAQGHTALQLGSDSTLTVSLGTERLRYAYATGDHVTQSLTRGVDWLQQLPHGLSLQAYARTQAAMHTTGVRTERRFGALGHRFGVELTHIDGRNGLMDDTQLRVTQTFAFGARPSVAPSARSSSNRQEFGAPMNALLDEVAARPAFLPLVPLAVVDPTVRAERLVAVDHEGMVPGTSIDQASGTVTVPAGAVAITSVTKNGAGFSNTGQFSVGNGDLRIHPLHMTPPASGIDEYVVVLQNQAGRLTRATVEVTKGSVHILRVTLTEEDEPETPADTTPEGFAFPPVTAAAARTLVASDAVVVSGINGPTPVSIVGGEYSLDGGPFTSTPGIVLPGQQVRVRVQAPPAPGTSATAILTIGGVSADFTVTAADALPVETHDTTPDAFAFAAQTGAAPDTIVTSSSVTIAGINGPSPISVTGGEYSIDGGPFTSAPGSILAGQAVRVRLTSASAFATSTTATVTIGGVSAPFTATTADETPDLGETPDVDLTPDAFSFQPRVDLPRKTDVDSEAVVVSGINAAAAIAVSGGEYSIDNGAFTSAPGTVLNGQSVVVRLTTSTAFSTVAVAVLTIGGVSAVFSATTMADADVPAAKPDPFSFTPQTDLAPGATATSNAVTVNGIDTPATISIQDGEYSIDGGPFTAASGVVAAGQAVRVRRHASPDFAATVTVTLTIGGVIGVFSVTTEAADTTPDGFSFAPMTDVALDAVVASDAIAVAGINTGAAVSIVGGEYSINSGGYTSAPGTVQAGDVVAVRVTSSSGYSTAVVATLTIGGVAASFTVTTLPEPGPDHTPDAFTFGVRTGVHPHTTQASDTIVISGIAQGTPISVVNGQYKLNNNPWTDAPAVLNNSDTVQVRHTSAAGFGTEMVTTLIIGTGSGTFTTVTKGAPAPDTTPDAFGFDAQTGVARSTQVESNTITVSGINTPASISITGGEYRVAEGAYTAAAGLVEDGQTVTVRVTSSASFATEASATLTIGGVNGVFSITTLGADTTPDAFSFSAQANVAPSTVVVSSQVVVAGINTGTAVSIVGGEYNINGGGYTSAPGTVEAGDVVAVRVTSSLSYSTAVVATLTIGGVVASFTVTTLADPGPDHTPDAFTFGVRTGVNPHTTQASDTIVISGIAAGTSISVVNGQYKLNNNPWTDVPGVLNNSDTVQVRHTSASGYTAETVTTLIIGTGSGTFTTVTRAADTTPDAFSFNARTGVARSTQIESNTITVSGINAATSISITGGEYSVAGGAYTDADGTVENGQTVRVRLTSSASFATQTSLMLTIGGVVGAFHVTTEAPDTTPNAFSFSAATDVLRNVPVESNTIVVAGINAPATISVTGGEYSLAGTAYTAAPGTVENGQTVRVRLTSAASFSTQTSATLTIGGVAGAFHVTTEAADTTPDAFSFADSPAERNVTVYSNVITPTGYNSAAVISVSSGSEYSVAGGPWLTAASTIQPQQTVQVRHQSAKGNNSSTVTTLTIGGVSGTFTSRTGNH